MLDPKLIRTDAAAVAEQLLRRGFQLDITALDSLEKQRKSIQTRTQELQSQRNTRSKEIGKVKGGRVKT